MQHDPIHHELRELLFPPDGVTEILYKGEWMDVKPGTFVEFEMTGVNFVQFIDPADGQLVFLLDRLIEGWKVDLKLVGLVEGPANPTVNSIEPVGEN